MCRLIRYAGNPWEAQPNYCKDRPAQSATVNFDTKEIATRWAELLNSHNICIAHKLAKQGDNLKSD